jgi:hypothetical protein
MLDKHRYYSYLTKIAKSNVSCFTKSLFILYEPTLRLRGLISNPANSYTLVGLIGNGLSFIGNCLLALPVTNDQPLRYD